MSRSLPIALAAALGLAACDDSRAERDTLAQEVVELRRTIDELKATDRAVRARAAQYRHLEFLGAVPPLAGPTRRYVVREMGTVPSPETSDYRDCVVVAVCEMVDDDDAPNGDRRLVALPVFHQQRLLPSASFLPGMVVRSQLVPWAEMPDSSRSIQRVDETDAFDLPMFAAIGASRSERARTETCRPPDGSAPTRAAAITASLRAIDARLAPHGTFEQWHRELAAVRQDLQAQIEASGGVPLIADDLLLRNVHYISHEPDEQWPEPQIAYFRALRDQFAARGIDLIVAPFPEREQITALQLTNEPPADGIVHAYRELWFQRLLQAGVEVIDLRPAIVDAIASGDDLYYCAIDGHPANGAIVAAARAIADRLRRYDELEPAFDHVLVQDVAFAIPRDHRKFPDSAHEGAPFHADVVMQPDGTHLTARTPGAPILVMGDSFVQCPDFYDVPSARLPDQITRELGVATSTFTVGGGAPQLMVHLSRADPETLAGVRVVVYVFREDYMFMHSTTESKYRWEIAPLPR